MGCHTSELSVARPGVLLVVILLCLSIGGKAEAQKTFGLSKQARIARLPPVATLPSGLIPDAATPASPELLPTPNSGFAPTDGGPYHMPEWLQAVSVERANSSSAGQQQLSEFDARIHEEALPPPRMQVDRLPADFRPWWDKPVREPRLPALQLTIGNLIEGALQYSSYVQVVATEPHIRRAAVVEEDAVFDWRGFLETTYNDVSEPVGNILTTGTNEDRFKDRTWTANAGVRRDNRLGGNLELSQQLGRQGNNSRFLLPNPQATTQLELRYTQPLLNGAGRAYNESRTVLAEIDANVSSDDLFTDLQSHLIKVTEAYWELYRARAVYFQRLRLLQSAKATLTVLEAREKVDVVQRQVLRARAAVATRRSEIIRAYTSIHNAESQLRLLVNDPALVQAGKREFTPAEAPLIVELPLGMGESLYSALQHRPDISRAIRDVRAASVRLGVAQKDILPKLDFVASTYVSGLASRADIGQSLISQLDAGRPSLSIGFVFDTPFQRRAARAQEERRQWEMRRAFSRFRLTVEKGLTDVEVAVREVRTNYREMVARYYAMTALTDEANYLQDRWRTLPGVDDSAMLLLENLLDAQERVADAEEAMVLAQVRYALSIVRLKQEIGTLLIARQCGTES